MHEVLLLERRKPARNGTGHEPEAEPRCCPDEALKPARGVLVGVTLGLALDVGIAAAALAAFRHLT